MRFVSIISQLYSLDVVKLGIGLSKRDWPLTFLATDVVTPDKTIVTTSI